MTDEALDHLIDRDSPPGSWARERKFTECMRMAKGRHRIDAKTREAIIAGIAELAEEHSIAFSTVAKIASAQTAKEVRIRRD